MSLHYNRAIVMLNVNWSGRCIVIMVMNPMLVVAVSVTPVMPTVVVCQGCAGADKDHKSRNCEYFHNVAFHGVLLFPLNLIRLDGTLVRRVYIGLGGYKEPGNPRRLTPIPARHTFQMD
jgi:hypothetical protein